MPLPNYAFFGGRIVPYSEAKIGVMSHALNYGTAVFGGMRGYWNQEEVFDLEEFGSEWHDCKGRRRSRC